MLHHLKDSAVSLVEEFCALVLLCWLVCTDAVAAVKLTLGRKRSEQGQKNLFLRVKAQQCAGFHTSGSGA